MAIVLKQICYIIFLFGLHFLLYSHGMERGLPKNDAKQSDQLRTKPLSADAQPFIPQDVLIAQQISNLPDDPWGMNKSHKQEKYPVLEELLREKKLRYGYNQFWKDSIMVPRNEQGNEWRTMEGEHTYKRSEEISGKNIHEGAASDPHRTTIGMSIQMQGREDNNLAIQHRYDQNNHFDSSQKLKSIQKNSRIIRKRKWRKRKLVERSQNKVEKVSKGKAVISRKNESEDGKSDEGSHMKVKKNDDIFSEVYINEGLEVSGNLEVNNSEQEKENLKQNAELSPDNPSIEKTFHLQQEQQHQQLPAAASSKTSNDGLQDVITKPMTQALPSEMSEEMLEKQHQHRKGKEKMKRTNKRTNKLREPKSSPKVAENAGAEWHLPKYSPGNSGGKQNVFPPAKATDSGNREDPQYGSSLHSTTDDKSDVAISGDPAVFHMPAPTMHASSPSSSGASDSTVKAVVIDEKTEEFNEIFQFKVASIVDSIQKLKLDKVKCEITKNKQKKKNNVSKLMNDYIKIMNYLNEFYETYQEQIGDTKGIAYIYIGDLFNWLKRDDLTPIMQQSLTFLYENLKNSKEDILRFDQFFENVGILREHVIAYDNAVKTYELENSIKEKMKAEMIKWYTNIVEGELRRVLHYICLGMYSTVNVKAKLSEYQITFGLSMLSMALETKSRKDDCLQAIVTTLKYLKKVKDLENADQEKITTEDMLEQPPQFKLSTLHVHSPASLSEATDSNGKTDTTKEKGVEIFKTIVNSIEKLVYKLENDKTDCFKLIDNEALKKEKLSKLKNDYMKILDDLDEFSETYYRGETELLYIGHMFDGINKAYEAPVIDSKNLTRIMEETLAYLDENLGDLDSLFEKIYRLKKYLKAYEEKSTEETKSEMIEFYMNNLGPEICNVISSLYLGLYTNGIMQNGNLSRNTVYSGLATLSVAVKSRDREFRQARLAVDKYMDIMWGPLEKTDANGVLEQIRNEDKNVQALCKHIEFVVGKITILKQELTNCFENNDPGKSRGLKMRLRLTYKSVVMASLTNFINEFGQKYGKTYNILVLKYVIRWMIEWYEGMEKFNADTLIETMQSSLDFLQGNVRAEDVTNFAVLLQNIDKLKAKADDCDKLAQSNGGYKDLATRDALQKVREFYLKDMHQQLHEAFGFLFIGKKIETAERLTKDEIRLGLEELAKVALPRYMQNFHDSILIMIEFHKFLHKSSVQEIGDNLTEYVAKILEIDFDPKDVTYNLDKLADRLDYPKIYVDGLKAIDELEDQLIEKNSSKNLPTESPRAGGKKDKKKTTGKRIESESTASGLVNISNIKMVLNGARKLIRFMNILLNILVVERKLENKVFEQAVYWQTYTIIFRDELSSTLDEWKTTYYNMKNDDSVYQKGVNESAILDIFSNGINSFVSNQRKAIKVNGEKLGEILNLFSQSQHLWHRLTHLRKWLNPDEKLDAASDCNCTEYDYLKHLD